ncbi:MAG: hypothetical protein E6Y11_07340 [Corynebacterium sp.]|nr:hypothetical protein [Corynebacterium sp.]
MTGQLSECLQHYFGAVQFVPFINRARIGDRGGKSEVTATLRRYAVAAPILQKSSLSFESPSQKSSGKLC